MAEELTADQKIQLLTHNLQEVLRLDIIEDVIKKQNRPLRIYWGTATTGRPHCGYLVPITHISQFLRAGCHVTILLADIHGFLDNLKAPIELVQHRAKYYRFAITALLRAVGVPIERLDFRLGSQHQMTPEYTMDIYRAASVVSEHDAKRAGAEVVKQSDNAPLSGLIYPIMQGLDEAYVGAPPSSDSAGARVDSGGVDCQFGGVDQRKIFVLASELLPKIGYKERAHLMNRMVPGLAGGKMSSSDPDSKIDILDSPEIVKKKIRKAYSVPRELKDNGLIALVEFVLLPVSVLQHGKGRFVVERREDEGPALIYETIEAVKNDYVADTLTPQLLKAAVGTTLSSLLAPIIAEYNASPEWQEIDKKAYPPPPEPQKKAKKVKNIGTRFPGASTGTSTAAGSAAALSEGQTEGTGTGEAKVTPAAVGESAADAIKKLDI